MTIPDFDSTLTVPLHDDEAVLDRVGLLVGRACRRQFWFLPLDHEELQLPILIPCDIPAEPDGNGETVWRRMLRLVSESARPASIVVALERIGPPQLDDRDRTWVRQLLSAARAESICVRGPVLSHSEGVRWIAAEDLG